MQKGGGLGPPSSQISWEDEGRACDKLVAGTGSATRCSLNVWFPAPRPDTRPVAASEELGGEAQESGVHLSGDRGYLGEVDTVPHHKLNASLSEFVVSPSTRHSCLPPSPPCTLQAEPQGLPLLPHLALSNQFANLRNPTRHS